MIGFGHIKNNLKIYMENNHINKQVYNLLEDLYAVGNLTTPRGFKCKGANLATLEIDPLYPLMDFKSRPFNWRYYAGELCWYLKKTNNIDFINNFSSFWKNISDNGKCNSNYGHILLNYHPSTVDENHHGPELIGSAVNQLEWAYNSLVKDKDSRQAVAFLNCPYYQHEGTKDFVCTMYLNFFINKDYLEMKVQMRSNDIFLGITYDSPWFSSIHQSMYLNLKNIYPDLKLGMYWHCADNIHYYEKHFDLVEKILDSELEPSIRFELEYPLFKFNDGKLLLSDEAIKFEKEVDNIVKKENISDDQEFWKNILTQLYKIG